jgi:hypothetical protein
MEVKLHASLNKMDVTGPFQTIGKSPLSPLAAELFWIE